MTGRTAELQDDVPAAPSPSALRRLKASLREVLGMPRAVTRRRRLRRRAASTAAAHLQLNQHWERLALRLLRLGGATADNAVRLFCDGDEAFEEIWQAIAQASRRVWFETYILEDDRVGRRTIEELASAARRGCEVVLIYDALGSSGVTDEFLQPLREAGAEIIAFNPLWRWPPGAGLLRRDHRKIIVVDDSVGFCGGMNVSEDYAGARHGNGRFRDCHMQLEGPCVRDLAGVFLGTVERATGKRRRLKRRPPRAGRTFVQVLASSGRTGRRAIQRAMRLTVRRAQQHCFITTPYFVPPRRLARAMTRAAQRGVDVRVLVAGRSDVPIVRAAAHHVYGRFLRGGVRIFEMMDATLHAKTIAIDGIYSTVGSFNLDQWSDKRNLEVNIGLFDPDVAKVVEGYFHDNLATAEEVTLERLQRRTIWRRALHWGAYQLLRL